ncbi:hypothetical protein ACEWY4_006120 [Coilia grayii]|uniref:Immunoglobulin subtype domain-containing protein n=1 Tax=Coilia grayii TaxID=363190 RepID=A0ABD1KCQ6_9TELE
MNPKHHLLLLAAILHTVACTPVSVFASEEKTVILTMNRYDIVDKEYVAWVFNETDIVTYYPLNPKDHKLRIWPSYLSRVEFDTGDLSVELKNLQKNDSGLYRGEIKTPENTTVVEYQLIVLETVQKPNITTYADWFSGDSCNLTVTCRAGDLFLTSTCNSSTCTQDGDSAHGGLTIFIKHGSIICNHSNPVSWSHAAVQTEGLCPFTQYPESVTDDKQTAVIVSTAVGVIILLVVVGGLLGFVTLSKKQGHAPNVYEEVNGWGGDDGGEDPPVEKDGSSHVEVRHHVW